MDDSTARYLNPARQCGGPLLHARRAPNECAAGVQVAI